jgi:two-component system C4-dicarboxylate transport response regulator DctD
MAELPVLIVDDNEFIRASMVKFLEAHGYAVMGVNNAKDAITYVHERTFGLVITDVLMPETDGFELVDYIRSCDKPLGDIPIIAISGGGRSIDADTVLSALEEKVQLILKKPFSKKELLDNVADIIRNSDRKKA